MVMKPTHLRDLLTISQILRQNIDDERFWGVLLTELNDIFNESIIFVALYDAMTDTFAPPPLLYMDAPMQEMPSVLVQAVLRHNITLQFDDLTAEHERLLNLGITPDETLAGITSWVGMPMHNRFNQPIGVLALQARANELNSDTITLLAVVTEQLSLALETQHALTSERKRRQIANSLVEVARTVNATLETTLLFERVIEQIKALVPFDRLVICVPDVGTQEWLVRACHGTLSLDLNTRLTVLQESPFGQVIHTQQPILVANTGDYARWGAQPSPLRAGNPQSWLGIPIATPNQLMGVIGLDALYLHAYDDVDMSALSALGRQVGITLENARLHENQRAALAMAQQRAKRLTALNHITSMINETLNVREIFDRAAQQLQEAFAVEYVTVIQLHAETRDVAITAEHPHHRLTGRVIAHVGTAIYKQLVELMRHAKPVILTAEARDAMIEQEETLQVVRTLFPQLSTLIVPMLAHDRPLGAICLSYSTGVDETDTDTLMTVAAQIAIAIRNAELYEEAVNANRLKSQFLANISHEFRTPLNAILGYTELLLEELFGELNTNQRNRLERIDKSGKHLLNIINDVLDIAQIDAGRMSLELAVLDAQPIIERIVRDLQTQATAKNISLTYTFNSQATVVGDHVRLQQVFKHLIENAIKFTEGGTVHISTQVLTFKNSHNLEGLLQLPPQYRVRDGDWLWVMVRDNGIGISEENQAAIFNLFQQADNSTRREYQGTGLGLTISDRLVKLHGGVIFVESVLGSGSVFHALLPAYLDKRATNQTPAIDAPRYPTLVLLDEDRITRAQLSEWAQDLYALYMPDSLNEALELIEEHAPCILVVDIAMSQYNLWDAIKQLKSRAVAYCAVVVVSGQDKRTTAYYLGVDDYLLKPLERDAFRASMMRYLPTR